MCDIFTQILKVKGININFLAPPIAFPNNPSNAFSGPYVPLPGMNWSNIVE